MYFLGTFFFRNICINTLHKGDNDDDNDDNNDNNKDEKDLNITDLNHLIYAAATVITEEINGIGEYKLQTHRSKTPPWVRRMQGSINGIRRKLSALMEIQRDNRNVMNIKRTRLLKKYNIEKKESLEQMIEELKQKVSAKYM
jgi:hypothetical protein